MVNISELRKDMQTYMTIEDVLKKHNISFQEAIQLLSKSQSRKPPKKKKKKKKQIKTKEKYISFYCGKYVIRKSVNGKVRSFGTYNSLEDAVKMRDYLLENGWYSNRVNAIRKRLGV